MAEPVTDMPSLFGTDASTPTSQATAPPVVEERAGDTKESGEEHQATQATTAIVTAKSTSLAGQTNTTTTIAKALQEDLYSLEGCTLCMELQFYPVGEDGHSRRVLLSLQNGVGNKEDLPLLAVLNMDELGGPLPPALLALWMRLEADLPLRKQRHDERAAKATVVKTTTSHTNAKGRNTTAAIAKSTPPLPPTTTTPIEKEGLAMGGLFD